MHLPVGEVLDQIACWKIAEKGAKEKRRSGGSLFEQMDGL